MTIKELIDYAKSKIELAHNYEKAYWTGYKAGVEATSLADTNWTPCSVAMPTRCSEFRVTVIDDRCGARFARNMDYNTHTTKWTDEKASELPSCYYIVAWQPLPQPWTGEKKGV